MTNDMSNRKVRRTCPVNAARGAFIPEGAYQECSWRGSSTTDEHELVIHMKAAHPDVDASSLWETWELVED